MGEYMNLCILEGNFISSTSFYIFWGVVHLLIVSFFEYFDRENLLHNVSSRPKAL